MYSRYRWALSTMNDEGTRHLLCIFRGNGDVPEPGLQAGLEHNAAERILGLGDDLLDGLHGVFDGGEERDAGGVPHQGRLSQPRLYVARRHAWQTQYRGVSVADPDPGSVIRDQFWDG